MSEQKDFIHLSLESYEELKKYKQAVVENKSIVLPACSYAEYAPVVKVYSDNETIKMLLDYIKDMARFYGDIENERDDLKAKLEK